MFVVLDTNHFREVTGATALAAKLESKISQAHSEVFLSIITVQEAAGGWLALINSTQAGQDQIAGYTSFQRTIAAFRHFDILPFDTEAAVIFHRLKSASSHWHHGSQDRCHLSRA